MTPLATTLTFGFAGALEAALAPSILSHSNSQRPEKKLAPRRQCLVFSAVFAAILRILWVGFGVWTTRLLGY